jgi:predicted unusual protein kinase regulating ubiquinone biosynthesis (AarF/ABC1/UbiB family)
MAIRKHVKSPTGRAVRMASMGMGIAGSYLGYLMQRSFLGEEARKTRLSSTHKKAARRMREEMQALRGPAMKLGQTLSLQSGVLPEEALAELASLQREAPGMHPSLARVQFKNSMKATPEDVFARFDDVPFAAASLGQVHRATLRNGTDVAVKIQYPGIRQAIESDFRWFRTVSKPAQATGHLPKFALDELEQHIVAETDYGQEADNIDFFRAGLAPLKFVSVPSVFREYSANQVLTMTFVPGRHIDDFLASRPSQAKRDLCGEHLLELFYFQFSQLEALHADPHWGNYLFQDDGTIGLVDFGCVKHFRKEFVEDLQSLQLYPGVRTTSEFRRLIEKRYTLFNRKASAATVNALVQFAEQFYRRVFPPEPERDEERFDFSDAEFIKTYMKSGQELARSQGVLPEYVFLGRAEMGLYHTLHRLKARVRTSKIVRRQLGTAGTSGSKGPPE